MKYHLQPLCTALLQTEWANAILPSDLKPTGQTKSNLLFCCGWLGLNGGRVFNCSAESLMRQAVERDQRTYDLVTALLLQKAAPQHTRHGQ